VSRYLYLFMTFQQIFPQIVCIFISVTKISMHFSWSILLLVYLFYVTTIIIINY